MTIFVFQAIAPRFRARHTLEGVKTRQNAVQPVATGYSARNATLKMEVLP